MQLAAAERRYQRAAQRAETEREQRNAIVRQALAEGMRPVDVAHATGLTRARIAQLVKADR